MKVFGPCERWLEILHSLTYTKAQEQAISVPVNILKDTLRNRAKTTHDSFVALLSMSFNEPGFTLGPSTHVEICKHSHYKGYLILHVILPGNVGKRRNLRNNSNDPPVCSS